ncbi:hypothetical protein AeRB84_013864 [Aphanomyces euteiches]|nr:hypothetical protein AeRB84_013864 [Aphanomyces euteiches]
MTRKVFLTLKQKWDLQLLHEEEPAMTLGELGLWVYETFLLPTQPSKSAISRALQQKINPEQLKHRPKLKSNKRVTSQGLEEELAAWIEACEHYGVYTTYVTIQAKASEISNDNYKSSCRYSNGWLQKFLLRHGLKKRQVHGEAASNLNEEDINEGRQELQELTKLYDTRNIYNLDETAYFYCQCSYHSQARVEGPQTFQEKDHICSGCECGWH